MNSEHLEPAHVPVVQAVRDGMKVVGRGNWLEPDRVALFTSGLHPGKLSDAASVVDVGNYFADRFTTIELSEKVSQGARRFFAVAKGTMVYATFFYPLLEIGLERAYSAVEVAVKDCLLQKGAPKRKTRNHAENIEWLCSNGWIDGAFCWDLHSVRERRNNAKHDSQNILMPIDAARTLHEIAKYLERLADVRDAGASGRHLPVVEHAHRQYPWQ